MHPRRSPSIKHVRDPIAQLVEEELNKLARSCRVKAVLESSQTGIVELRFDNIVVTGGSRDIALVRLGGALLDDKRYGSALKKTLGPRLNAYL